MGKYFMFIGIYTHKFSHNLLNYVLVFKFSDAVFLGSKIVYVKFCPLSPVY